MREVDGDAQINIIDRGYAARSRRSRKRACTRSSPAISWTLSCRRDHDERLPLQIEALGQPERGGHDLHAVLKGCNSTAWIKAKPEGQGFAVDPFYASFNPEERLLDVRHRPVQPSLIESDERLGAWRANGVLQPVAWHDVLPVISSLDESGIEGGCSQVSHVRSRFERRVFAARARLVTVGWQVSVKPQPRNAKFVVPEVDAPNVNGARASGLASGAVGDPQGPADLSYCAAVESGAVNALRARFRTRRFARRHQPIVAAQLALGLRSAVCADGAGLRPISSCQHIVCRERGVLYHHQGAAGDARTPPPGEAAEDWQILVKLLSAMGVPVNFETAGDVRNAIQARYAGTKGSTASRH